MKHEEQTFSEPVSPASCARPEDIGGAEAEEAVLGALVRGAGSSVSGADRFNVDAAGAYRSVEADVGTDAVGAREGRTRSRPNPRAEEGTGRSGTGVSTSREGRYFGINPMPCIL